MGLWDNIKNIMTIPEEDEYEEEQAAAESESYETEEQEAEPPRKEKSDALRIIRSRSAAKNQPAAANGAMQVFLARPERFDDVTEIADNLNAGKTAILNLEEANREVSRRIVDFLSGVAYANGGNMKKVSKNTFVIAAHGVDVSGNFLFEEIEEKYL